MLKIKHFSNSLSARKNTKQRVLRYNEEELINPERNNRSLVDKSNSRNNLSPGYPREKSVILPELSRSPAITEVSFVLTLSLSKLQIMEKICL